MCARVHFISPHLALDLISLIKRNILRSLDYWWKTLRKHLGRFEKIPCGAFFYQYKRIYWFISNNCDDLLRELSARNSLTQLLLPISAEIICVEKRINRLIKVNGFISDSDLARYIIGGKHLRAAIVLLIGKMFNVEMEPFHRLSSSIEMLHSATLAHDDLVDGGSIRRNHATSSSHTFPRPYLLVTIFSPSQHLSWRASKTPHWWRSIQTFS